MVRAIGGRGSSMTPSELLTRRRSLGLTQERLAQMLGVAANTVARWERGERPIRSPALVLLALERLEARAPAGVGASGARTRLAADAGQQLLAKRAPTLASHPGVSGANSPRNR